MLQEALVSGFFAQVLMLPNQAANRELVLTLQFISVN